MRRIVLGIVALLLAAPAAVSAQEARQGFWFSGGLSLGSAAISGDLETDGREAGVSLSLGMGGTLRPNLLIGGELNGWAKDVDGVDAQFGYLTGVAQYYPIAGNDLYLKGGLGFGQVTLEDNINQAESMGFALQVGAGYDWRLAPRFSVTPYFNYVTMLGAKAEVDGASTDATMNGNLFQIGVAATWH